MVGNGAVAIIFVLVRLLVEKGLELVDEQVEENEDKKAAPASGRLALLVMLNDLCACAGQSGVLGLAVG